MTHAKNTIVSLIPSLRYADAAKAIDWLCDAFGFERHLVVPGENGAIAHAQLTFGNGMLMLGSAGEHGDRPFDRLVQPARDRDEPRSGSLYVIVEDADVHCARARTAGAEIVDEPKDEDYGGRGYTCRDLEGHVWTFGTYDPYAGTDENRL